MRIVVGIFVSFLTSLVPLSAQVNQFVSDTCSNIPGIQDALGEYDLVYLVMSDDSFQLREFNVDLLSMSEMEFEVPQNTTSNIVLSPDSTKLALGLWSYNGNIPEIQIVVIDLYSGQQITVFQEQSENFHNLMNLEWITNTTLGFVVNYNELQFITVEIGGKYTDHSLISAIGSDAEDWFAVFNNDYSTIALIQLTNDEIVVRFVDRETTEEYNQVYRTSASDVFNEHNFSWTYDNQHFLIMDGQSRDWLNISLVTHNVQIITNVGDKFYLTYPVPSPNLEAVAFAAYLGKNWTPESYFLGIWDSGRIHEVPVSGWNIIDKQGWHPQSRLFAFVTQTYDEQIVISLFDTENDLYCELDRLSPRYGGASIVGWLRDNGNTNQ